MRPAASPPPERGQGGDLAGRRGGIGAAPDWAAICERAWVCSVSHAGASSSPRRSCSSQLSALWPEGVCADAGTADATTSASADAPARVAIDTVLRALSVKPVEASLCLGS